MTRTSALSVFSPPRSPMWISLICVSINIATVCPFSSFSLFTRSTTVWCYSCVPWNIFICATLIHPANISSCSNSHVSGPIVHTNFVRFS
ncbi:hypothetical protein TorRG33x02_233210 [Trema orientale]|uniref:Uncharacterized protein n=1 Tax=Trema orientale TaxID=63057 RepID=A0A2P5E5K4_TREOI|nr:hypothetical protein TorRG33x02_233210 [Trema orientale]